MRSLRHPATIISILALGASLTGSAFASGLINGSQIRNNTISSAKLTPALRGQINTINGSRISNNTISAAKLAPALLAQINMRPIKSISFETVASPAFYVASEATGTATATCPVGTTVVSGGFFSSIGTPGISEQSGNGWALAVFNNTLVDIGPLYAYATCAY